MDTNPDTSAHEGHAGHAGHSGGATVAFQELREGMNVTSPVRVAFTLPGDGATGTTPPAGTRRQHLGIGNGCLAAGTSVPNGSPFVALPDELRRIDVRLSPGPHTLTIQVADASGTATDQCASVRVTVTR